MTIDSAKPNLKIDKKLTKPAWVLSDSLEIAVFVLLFGLLLALTLYSLLGAN